MEPHDTIDRICRQECYSNADLSRLRSLTEVYPDDARLWDVLGDITQLVDGSSADRSESLECYKRSIACDPEYAPAHESLGYWYDIEARFELAAQHFRLAIDNGGGDTALIGYARVLE
jgi:tetratricopeptide (TPR) repeat protein